MSLIPNQNHFWFFFACFKKCIGFCTMNKSLIKTKILKQFLYVHGKIFTIDFISSSKLSTMKHFGSQVGFHVFMTENASVIAEIVSSCSTNDATI